MKYRNYTIGIFLAIQNVSFMNFNVSHSSTKMNYACDWLKYVPHDFVVLLIVSGKSIFFLSSVPLLCYFEAQDLLIFQNKFSFLRTFSTCK